MCLIVYQPRGTTAPPELLRSAAEYNPDGFGFMGFDAGSALQVARSAEPGFAAASALAERYAGQECVYHFRRRTRGSSQDENLHPFEVAPGLLLMHNGTASEVPIREAGRSDTWHLVNDYLGPLLKRRPQLIYDRAFRQVLDRWLGPQNRVVFLDAARQRVELLHREIGHEWRGLWLSNTRWVDRRLLSLGGSDGVFRVAETGFCI